MTALGARGFPKSSWDKSERNADIIAARERGETLESLARQHGVTRQRIEQIVNGPRPARGVKPKPLSRLIAYAEEAIPRWRSGLEVWNDTGMYRGKRIDAQWLRWEAASLRELELQLASWRQRQREGYENDF